MKKLSKIMPMFIIFLVLFSVFLIAAPEQVYANNHADCRGNVNFLSLPTWYQYLDVSAAPECNVTAVRYDGSDDVNIGATLGAVLLAITEILLRIAGIVAVGFVVYGGILYTMSQAAPDKLQAARQTIINGIIGLFIASAAVALVNLAGNIIF